MDTRLGGFILLTGFNAVGGVNVRNAYTQHGSRKIFTRHEDVIAEPPKGKGSALRKPVSSR